MEADIKRLEECLETARKQSDVSGEFQALTKLGQLNQAKRQNNQALACFWQAENLVKDQGTQEDQGLALANLGCIHWEMAQLKKALECFEAALIIFTEIGEDAGRSMALVLMGISYWRKLEWVKAITLFEQSLDIRNHSMNSASSKYGEERFDGLQSAVERGVATLRNRIHIAQEHNDPERVLLSCFSLVPLLFFSGRKAEIPALFDEIVPLARQLNREDILNAIPKLNILFKID